MTFSPISNLMISKSICFSSESFTFGKFYLLDGEILYQYLKIPILFGVVLNQCDCFSSFHLLTRDRRVSNFTEFFAVRKTNSQTKTICMIDDDAVFLRPTTKLNWTFAQNESFFTGWCRYFCFLSADARSTCVKQVRAVQLVVRSLLLLLRSIAVVMMIDVWWNI